MRNTSVFKMSACGMSVCKISVLSIACAGRPRTSGLSAQCLFADFFAFEMSM